MTVQEFEPLLMKRSQLSQKAIPVRERLILALDVPTMAEAKAVVNLLGDSVQFYKIGLELLMSGDYFTLIDWLVANGKKVFADVKINDVPETTRKAMEGLKHRKVVFVTIHANNDDALRAAISVKNGIKVLAVTVLTSLDQSDLISLGFPKCDVKTLVLARARRALAIGADGVISSGLEASALRDELGDNFLIVSPGIRPVENREIDDQKRVVDVEQAFEMGADYIVVGRPIRNAKDPKEEAENYQSRIAALFES
jgi:orotidine-5'-phosphate decarboxylase